MPVRHGSRGSRRYNIPVRRSLDGPSRPPRAAPSLTGGTPPPRLPKGRFVASTSQSTAQQNITLPREFEHPALQELLARGTAQGRVDAESFRTACETAGVGDAKRLKAVLKALSLAGVEVGKPTVAKVAA